MHLPRFTCRCRMSHGAGRIPNGTYAALRRAALVPPGGHCTRWARSVYSPLLMGPMQRTRSLRAVPKNLSAAAAKRVVDFLTAAVLLSALLPFLTLVAALIRLDSRGPVFFRQERIGVSGRPFTIWKFRTMVEGAISKGAGIFVTEEDPRITRLGKWLRALSIDELPQLINVLCGEMSLVGPRPTVRYQVEQYDAFQWQRLKALPGITGLAQVSGRNTLSWPDRIKLDVWYVRNWCLPLDFRILLRTVRVVVAGSDTYTNDLSKFQVSASGEPEARRQGPISTAGGISCGADR